MGRRLAPRQSARPDEGERVTSCFPVVEEDEAAAPVDAATGAGGGANGPTEPDPHA